VPSARKIFSLILDGGDTTTMLSEEIFVFIEELSGGNSRKWRCGYSGLPLERILM
jgi:hypothetical protein